MGIAFSQLGGIAAKCSVPLLIGGVGITIVGAALQIAQARGYIGPLPVPAGATVFGLFSKIGGAAMLSGLVCGALRDGHGSGIDADQPLRAPISARKTPAPDLAISQNHMDVAAKRPVRVTQPASIAQPASVAGR